MPALPIGYTACMPPSLAQRHDAPKRSADQCRDALALANRVRTQRAMLKAELKRGGVSLVTLLGDPPRYLDTARIAELLSALPGYGPVKVGRLLERCHVSPRRTVSGLNERQRDDLVKAL